MVFEAMAKERPIVSRGGILSECPKQAGGYAVIHALQVVTGEEEAVLEGYPDSKQSFTSKSQTPNVEVASGDWKNTQSCPDTFSPKQKSWTLTSTFG